MSHRRRTMPSPSAQEEKPDPARAQTHISHPCWQARSVKRDKAELNVRPQRESVCVQYWLLFDPCHSLLSCVSPQAPHWPSLTVCLATHTHTEHEHCLLPRAWYLTLDGVGSGALGAEKNKRWKKGGKNNGFGFRHVIEDKWSDSIDPLWLGDRWRLRDGWPRRGFDGMLNRCREA